MVNNMVNNVEMVENFENWSVLEGIVSCSPVKVTGENEFYYNFKIDTGKFKMNCTINVPEASEDIEKEIFESIKEGNIIKVSGRLFLKRKIDKLWVQINVKTWVETKENGVKEMHKVG